MWRGRPGSPRFLWVGCCASFSPLLPPSVHLPCSLPLPPSPALIPCCPTQIPLLPPAPPQVCDWSKEHYFRGAYTYPTLGAHLGDRDTLAAPVSGTVFFAGEGGRGGGGDVRRETGTHWQRPSQELSSLRVRLTS